MSTYLLVCVVGRFERAEVEPSKDGVRIGGYTPVGYAKQITHYLELIRESLEFYTDYFGIPFPLKKMDLVSLHKMNVRAMENWGCITFANYVLLTDVNHASA